MQRSKKYFVTFIMIALFSFSAMAEEKPAPRLITVTGNAEVKVVPDEIIIMVEVETDDKDLNTAKNQNDERTKRVLALAKEFNIERQYVQTSHMRVEPRYTSDYSTKRREFIGYFVHKSIIFTLRNTSKFEDFISSLLKSGVNYINNVDFRSTDLRKYRDQARALAIKAAQEKATALAKELGQKVGRPYSITENPSRGWSYGEQISQSMMAVELPADIESSEVSTVALGQIPINASITVSFELE
jgi:uncharacterized protein YggE